MNFVPIIHVPHPTTLMDLMDLEEGSNKRKATDTIQAHHCEACDTYFSTRGNLRRHNTKHTGVKNHVCKICQKDFSRSDDLKSHSKTHNTDRPHRCSIIDCKSTFKRLSDCRKHERRVHKYAHKTTATGKKTKPKKQAPLPSKVAPIAEPELQKKEKKVDI